MRLSPRVVDVAILLPDLRGGGAERVGINLANEFVSRGFSVDMLLMRASGELMALLDPKINVVEFGVDRARGVLRPLIRYLRGTRPASMLACMWPLTILASAARFVSGAKMRLVVAEHTTWSSAERSGDKFHMLSLSATMRLTFPGAQAVVAVSRGAADDLAGMTGVPRHRVVAIHNPIVGGAKPASALTPGPHEWASGSHHKILAIGTLKAIKDYDTLLEAFAFLRRGINAKLLILGEGDQRFALERKIADLGLGSEAFMPGFTANPDASYRAADLHVLSSTGEGFGNVIVEALEAGTPVVSTDCPSGPREILDHGRYGTLVPVGDPGALAQAMREALTRKHDTDALRARAADFSVGKAADAYLDLLLPDWRQQPSLLKVGG